MAGRRALSSNGPSKKGKQVAPRLPPILPFGLPFVPLDKVFKEMSLLDLIKFSFISERSRNLVENYFTVPAERLELNYSRESHIFLSVPGKQDFSFFLNDDREQREEHCCRFGRWPVWEVWGVRLVMYTHYRSRPNKGVIYFYSTADKDRFYALFSRFLVKVFKTENITLQSHLYFHKDTIFTILEHSPRSKLKAMEIKWTLPKSVDLLELQELLDSADQIKLHLNLVKLKYTGPLNPRKLEVINASWLTVESLKQMKCESLKAEGTMLTAEDVNEFLKAWKQGQDLTFCYFSQQKRFWIDPKNDAKMGKVLEGLEAAKGVPPNMVLNPVPPNTWYFKMQSGSLVTMQLSKERLKFIAWNTKRLGNRDLAKFFCEDLENHAAFHDD